MKLGAALTLVGLSSGVAALGVFAGCSSDETSSTPSEVGKTVPEAVGSPTTSTEERVFAVNSIKLGETDRSGARKEDAWKSFGYNLDGFITSATDRNSPALGRVCKLAQGASSATHQDGDDGIDNSFGKNILPLIVSLNASPSKAVDDNLTQGKFTILMKIVGLTEEPEQTATGLSGKLLVGGLFSEDGSKVPTFTTADDWPYLQDPQIDISGAYINKGEFVNGAKGATVRLAVNLTGETLNLTINNAIITFKNNPGGKSLEEGTIAGVVKTDEIVESVKKVAGTYTCSQAAIDGIVDSIKKAADILTDGSQDPSKTCDAISIGLGFTAKQVGNPTKIAPPPEPTGDPCADAGQ